MRKGPQRDVGAYRRHMPCTTYTAPPRSAPKMGRNLMTPPWGMWFTHPGKYRLPTWRTRHFVYYGILMSMLRDKLELPEHTPLVACLCDEPCATYGARSSLARFAFHTIQFNPRCPVLLAVCPCHTSLPPCCEASSLDPITRWLRLNRCICSITGSSTSRTSG